MVLKADQERVKTLLRDTITLLCKNGLTFKTKFCIEAVIGVTLDDNDVFLLSMNDIVNSDKPVPPAPTQDSGSEEVSSSDERRRKRKRKRPRVKKEVESGSAEEIIASSDEENEAFSPIADDSRLEVQQQGAEFSHQSTNQGFQQQGAEFSRRSTNQGSELNGSSDNKTVIQIKEEVDDSVWAGNDNPNQGVNVPDFPIDYLDQDQQLGSDNMSAGVPQQQWASPGLSRGARTATVTSGGDLSQSFDASDMMNTSLGGSQQDLVKKDGRYSCGLCYKSYSQKGSLKKHLQCHAGIYPYPCTLCDKGFVSPANLRGHVLSVHSGIREFQCSECSKSYVYQRDLNLHMLYKHK